MLIKTASFVTSSASIEQCPPGSTPEFAFIGRSNVGKSSLINMLCGVKELAKTSSTPGKTQLINHFMINDKWYLVDLPGYGFAKVSKTQRFKWSKNTEDYFLKRENLYCVFVLVDSRVKPMESDVDMINFLGKHQIPVCMLYTKTDKIKSLEVKANVEAMKGRLVKSWDEFPETILTSATTSRGKEEILEFIGRYI